MEILADLLSAVREVIHYCKDLKPQGPDDYFVFDAVYSKTDELMKSVFPNESSYFVAEISTVIAKEVMQKMHGELVSEGFGKTMVFSVIATRSRSTAS
jgi:hypothetical protein